MIDQMVRCANCNGDITNDTATFCAECGNVNTQGRKAVTRFAAQMEAKLREHDSIRGDSWGTMSTQELFERLRAEVEELRWAWDREDKRVECVDVANFAMFLWDRLKGETDG